MFILVIVSQIMIIMLLALFVCSHHKCSINTLCFIHPCLWMSSAIVDLSNPTCIVYLWNPGIMIPNPRISSN